MVNPTKIVPTSPGFHDNWIVCGDIAKGVLQRASDAHEYQDNGDTLLVRAFLPTIFALLDQVGLLLSQMFQTIPEMSSYTKY